ncbi:sulfotransferase [Rhodobacter sp. CZR27]|uniref:sulfotransferase n=1 Tax=Rhodobacter sp. CZR27 TaxID=2033869 RepID=UPI0012FD32C6|nr:sulfotransferase [Rhodobacter sp. CZR27]
MGDYRLLDRLLHRAALQVGPIAELSFDLDQRSARIAPDGVAQGRHVFVSGLARAGTTILMRRIHASGQFRSLTYRDMPFVLAPNLWGRLAGGSSAPGEAKERAHGDRIRVDADSPESLDEVFWRIFDGSYIASDHLSPHDPDDATLDRYVRYVAAILASGRRQRYLSKNNNAILRLPALRRAFPKAVILVPFRDPLTHAASLQRQHGNFLARQDSDRFVRAYMRWLGHHEFGRDHRPFRFDAEGATRLAPHRPDGIGYWLEIWRQTYGWLERTAPADAVFVCYESLCRDPAVWAGLAALCAIDPGPTTEEPFSPSKLEPDDTAPPDLLAEARALYDRLADRAARALPPVRDASRSAI